MSDSYILSFEVKGLEGLNAALKTAEDNLKRIGALGDSSGLSRTLSATTSKLEEQSVAMQNMARTMQQTAAAFSGVVDAQVKSMESASKRGGKSVKSMATDVEDSLAGIGSAFKDVRKNFKFDEVQSVFQSIKSGSKMSEAEVKRSHKTLLEFKKLVQDLGKTEGFAGAFQKEFGSSAGEFIQSSKFVDSLRSFEKSILDSSFDREWNNKVKSAQDANAISWDRYLTQRQKVYSELEKAGDKQQAAQVKQLQASAKAQAEAAAREQADWDKYYKAREAAYAREVKDGDRAADAQRRNQARIRADKEKSSADALREYERMQQTLKRMDDRAEAERIREANMRSANVRKQQEAYAKFAESDRRKNKAYREQIESVKELSGGHVLATRAVDNQVTAMRNLAKEYARIAAIEDVNVKRRESKALRQQIGTQMYNDMSRGTLANTLDNYVSHQTSLGSSMSTAAMSDAAAIDKAKKLKLEMAAVDAAATRTRNNFHQTWRGITSAAGNIWLSWSSALGPMLAGFATASATMKSIKLGKEFGWELQMVGVAAEAGDKTINSLKTSILEMADANVVQGPMQMAKALRVLAQAGMGAEDSLKALRTTLDLALVANVSDEQSALYLAGMRSAFNLNNSDGSMNEELLRGASDMTAKAAEVSQTSVQAIMESMKQASSEAAKFNVSIAETNTLIAELAKVNITGSSAGTAVKNLLTDLSGRTPKAQKALQELGITMFNAQGMTRPILDTLDDLRNALDGMSQEDKAHWLRKIFNERGMRAANVLLNETSENLRKMFNDVSRANENMGYSAVQAERLANTSEGVSRRFSNAWEGAFIRVGEASKEGYISMLRQGIELANSPAVLSSLTGIVNAVTTLGSALSGVVGIAANFSSAFTGIAAAIGVGMIASMGKMVLGTTMFTGAWTTLTAAIAAARTTYLSTTAGMMVMNSAMVSTSATTTAATAAMTRAGIAASGLATASRAFVVALGPIGLAATAIGGLAWWFSRAKVEVDLFKESMKGVEDTVLSVSSDFLEKFNKTGDGFNVDRILGVGFNVKLHNKLKPEDPIEIEKTLLTSMSKYQDFYDNLTRINNAFATVREKSNLAIKEGDTKLTKEQLENNVMLYDRKQTFLLQELEEYDKFMNGKNELSKEEIKVRSDIEREITDNYSKMLAARLELARQHVADIAAEVEKERSAWKSLFDAGEMSTNLARAAVMNSPEMKAKAEDLRTQGMSESRILVELTGTPWDTTKVESWISALNRGTLSSNLAKYGERGGAGIAQLELELKGIQTWLKANKSNNGMETEQEVAFKKIEAKVQSQLYWARQANSEAPSSLTQIKVPSADLDHNKTGPDDSKEKKARKRVVNPYDSAIGSEISSELSDLALKTMKDTAEAWKVQLGYVPKDLAEKIAAEEANKMLSDFDKTTDQWRKKLTDIRRKLVDDEQPAEAKAKMREEMAQIVELIKRRSGAGKVDLGYDFVAGAKGTVPVSVVNTGDLVKPLQSYVRVSDKFGVVRTNSDGTKRTHKGIDLAAPNGTPVNSTINGRVTTAGRAGNFGNLVVVKGADGLETYYAHLSEIAVKVGDVLSAGMNLGKVGSTGRSSGNHLHYEERRNGKILDPTATATRGAATTGVANPTNGDITYGAVAQSTTQKEAGDLFLQSQKLAENHKTREAVKQQAQQLLETEMQINREIMTREQFNLQELAFRQNLSAADQERAQYELDKLNLMYESEQKIQEIRAKTGEIASVEEEREIRITEEKLKQLGLQQEINENRRTIGGGMDAAVKKVRDEAENDGAAIEKGFTSVFDGAANAFANFVTTGKFSFREFTASILTDLAKIAARMAIMKMFESMFSSFGGASARGSVQGGSSDFDALFARGGPVSSLTAFASGGMVNSPTKFYAGGGVGLMGEAGTEGIFPLSRMANGDLGLQVAGVGGMGGGAVTNVITVQVNVSEGEAQVEQSEAETGGADLAKAIKNVVVDEIVRQTRAGGIIDQRFIRK